MASAQESAGKYVERASSASGDYVDGARKTQKDPTALAAAAVDLWKSGVNAAGAAKRFTANLSSVGKSGWLKGVTDKGGDRYSGGVAASSGKYAQNSGVYDTARGAAEGKPRGLKGSQQNFDRAIAVGKALHALKTGNAA